MRYKGRSLPRAEVDEIVNAGGIAIFAGRRQIELPVGFSEIAATPALLAELGRLILPPGR